MTIPLWRRVAAEAIGTCLLVAVVVGSGIAAASLSRDVGVQLLANAFATALGLAVLILVMGPVSGGHFNPVVSAVAWLLDGRGARGLRDLAAYVLAQLAGGIAGAVLANLMFSRPAVTLSTTERTGAHLWLAEVVATAGLVLLIFALLRSGRVAAVPAAVGGYIGAAYWFTSSTSFANPAVTIGRAFSDTFAGIALSSVPGFLVAQVIGGLVGLALIVLLYPVPVRAVTDAVVPASEPAT